MHHDINVAKFHLYKENSISVIRIITSWRSVSSTLEGITDNESQLNVMFVSLK